MTTRLFVYGTLKRGCKNHHHLAGQIFVGETRTAPGYRLYDLGDYPGMIADPTDIRGVTGELWDVTPAALAHLDAFEGVHEGLYRREPVRLMSSAPTRHADSMSPVFTYLYARDPGSRPLGDTWTER